MVIAIIATLLGLLLPAVQSARESARRITCASNLKQIGLALLVHENAKKVFPAGTSVFYYEKGSSWAGDSSNQAAWAWSVFILPFLENGSLYDQLNPGTNKLKSVLDVNLSGPGMSATALGKAQVALQTPISFYRCPDDVFPTATRKGTVSNNKEVTPSSYAAAAGHDAVNPCGGNYYCDSPCGARDTGGILHGFVDRKAVDPGKGPLGEKSSTITDGATKTVLISEKATNPKWPDYTGAVWMGVYNTRDIQGDGLANIYGRAMGEGINSDLFDVQGTSWTNSTMSGDNIGKGFGSRHPGGCHFVFADGAVVFVSETIPSSMLRALYNRKDGTAVNMAGY